MTSFAVRVAAPGGGGGAQDQVVGGPAGGDTDEEAGDQSWRSNCATLRSWRPSWTGRGRL